MLLSWASKPRGIQRDAALASASLEWMDGAVITGELFKGHVASFGENSCFTLVNKLCRGSQGSQIDDFLTGNGPSRFAMTFANGSQGGAQMSEGHRRQGSTNLFQGHADRVIQPAVLLAVDKWP